MQSTSPNPTSMMRWEASSGLEHSCWVCKTKSNSPKAVNTCFGIHSMPCIAYHTTMHAVGTAHGCKPCGVTREVHDGRHREIAELVARFHAPEVVMEAAPFRRRVLGERPANMGLRRFAQDEDEADEEEAMVEALSESTTSDENSSRLKLTKAERRELKRASKTRKSIDKAAKSEAKKYTPQITMDEVKRIESILHGDEADQPNDTHPLATDQTIEDVIARNLGFVKRIHSHNTALYESIRAGRKEQETKNRNKRRVSEGGEDIKMEAVVDAILIALNIDPSREKANGKRNRSSTNHGQKKLSVAKAKIITKLRAAIKKDLETHENDRHQTYLRAGGFFRYAGKAVFDRMTEIGKAINLETGEIREREA